MENYKLKRIIKNFKAYIKMGEKIIKFGDTEKHKFYTNRKTQISST